MLDLALLAEAAAEDAVPALPQAVRVSARAKASARMGLFVSWFLSLFFRSRSAHFSRCLFHFNMVNRPPEAPWGFQSAENFSWGSVGFPTVFLRAVRYDTIEDKKDTP